MVLGRFIANFSTNAFKKFTFGAFAPKDKFFLIVFDTKNIAIHL